MTSKVVVSMILGNEENVIGRCLEHVLPHVDGAVLSVNGKDGTKEIAEKLVQSGDIFSDPWKNFGWNRTRAFRYARNWAISEGFDPRETFVLLIDADMVLRVEDPEYREQLTHPHFYLEQRCGPVLTQNSRLLRLDHDWKCVGSTHEHWAPFPDVQPIPFGGIWIEDVNDGGEHSKKYVRDAELLEEAVLENPEDVRALFYLGETYFHWAQQAEERKDTVVLSLRQHWLRLARQRYQNAIEYYNRRIKLGGWDEEKWFAEFKRALAVLALETRLDVIEIGSGTGLLLDAYNSRPSRAEPIAALSRYYRERSKHRLAVQFAKMAREVPPTNDFLFVDRRAWGSGPDEDLAICCYYLGEIVEGLAACERLAGSRENAPWLRGFGADNARWYTPRANGLRRGKFDVPAEFLENGVYAPSTPTVAMVNGDRFVLVRLVNYRQDRGRSYVSPEPNNLIRTKNYSVEEEELLSDYSADGWRSNDLVQGLEDCRLAALGNEVLFTATTYDGDPPTGNPRVVLGHLDPINSYVKRVVELDYPAKRDVEKNWVPFFDDEDGFFLVYEYEPLVILSVNQLTGSCTEILRHALPWCADRWRGGAAARNWGPAKLLLLIHQVTRLEDRNLYFHRFVEVDLEDLSRSRKTPPFVFDHQGIEYAAGLLVVNETIFVTYSIEDREACWIEFSRAQIEEMLK